MSGAFRSWYKDGVTGLLVPPADPRVSPRLFKGCWTILQPPSRGLEGRKRAEDTLPCQRKIVERAAVRTPLAHRSESLRGNPCLIAERISPGSLDTTSARVIFLFWRIRWRLRCLHRRVAGPPRPRAIEPSHSAAQPGRFSNLRPVLLPLTLFFLWTVVAALASPTFAGLTIIKKFFIFLILLLVPLARKERKNRLDLQEGIRRRYPLLRVGLIQFIRNPERDLLHRISGFMGSG